MEQKILTANQIKVLSILSKSRELSDSFYLSGGTALAGYYIPYRLSDDLDFFCKYEFEPLAIAAFLKKYKKTIGYNEIDFQKSFNRNLFFLKFETEVLKIEFTYYPFPQIFEPKIIDSVKIDSLLDIAVNKVFTISQNPRTRDFIDLFMIFQKEDYDFFDLLKKARVKFDWHIDPINLGTQLLKCKEIKEYPILLEEINDEEWQDYFLNIAKEIGKKL